MTKTLSRDETSSARPWLGCEAGPGCDEAITARRAVLLIILFTALIRIAFAASLGLGIDESYTVATARHFQLGYFDHPPLAWWLAWGAAHLSGGESALALRAPFIALFALTSWLMFALTRLLFGERAGLWAVLTLNCAPVLAWTSGTWILPDGPLNAALLAGAYCAARALFVPGNRAPLWWLAAGACGGLALMAKLHGVFLFAGIGLFLLSSRPHRHWLASPWPYLGAGLAALVCLPMLAWNAEHGWIALTFQADRADPSQFKPWAPLATLAGQALYLLPWLWLPLMLCLIKALWNGPARERQWLLACLAIGPILIFTCVGWLGTRALPHWAAPGYLMLFPLLGNQVAEALAAGRRRTRPWLIATAASMAILLACAMLLARLPWPPLAALQSAHLQNPLLDTRDWTGLGQALRARGYLGRPNLFVAASGWEDAGKIDYALHGAMPVLCLSRNPHAYGMLTRPAAYRGDDALIVGRDLSYKRVKRLYATSFANVRELSRVIIMQGGKPALALSIYYASGFRGWPEPAPVPQR